MPKIKPMRGPAITRSALLLAAAVAALAASSPAQAAPSPGLSIAGAEAGSVRVGQDLAQARALGAKLVRIELPWRWLEPEAAGQRDAARLADVDALMARARVLGLRVVLLLDETPCWTSTAPVSIRLGCRAEALAYPPADYAAYADLAGFLTERYADVLGGFEVWNEPDQSNERYWAGPDKVRRYVRLLKATYPVVKAAAPSVPVIGGSFVGTDGRWLRALYAAGAKGYYDGLSVHFYDLGLRGLRQTHAVQRAHGDKTPLWLLETGWNSCKPRKQGQEGQPCVTRARQAVNLRDLFAQVGRTSWVRAVVVYKLRDDFTDKFGVLTTTGLRKPSFAALRRAWTGGPGRASGLTFEVRARGGVLRVRGSGPEGDAYQLTVRQRGTLRYRAEFRLDSSNHFDFALPAQLGTRGLELRVAQPWSGKGIIRRV